MAINISCPECGESMRFSDRIGGKTVSCPNCEASLAVPKPAPAAAPPKKRESPGAPRVVQPVATAPPIRTPATQSSETPIAKDAPPKSSVSPPIAVAPAVVPRASESAFSVDGSETADNTGRRSGRAAADRVGTGRRRRSKTPAILATVIAGGLLLALVVVGIAIARRPATVAMPLPTSKLHDSEDVVPQADSPPANQLTLAESDSEQAVNAIHREPGRDSKFTEIDGEEFEETIEIEPTKATTFDPASLPDFNTTRPESASSIVGDSFPAPSSSTSSETIEQTEIPAVSPDPATVAEPVGDEAVVPLAAGAAGDPLVGMPAANQNPLADPAGRFDALPAVAVPEPACDKCRDSGRIPTSPFEAYVSIEGSDPPKTELALIDQPCPKCHPDVAQAENDAAVAAMEIRLTTGAAKHQPWEQKTGWPLVQVQTKLATIHAQLPVGEAKQVGFALERLAMHMLELTKTTDLASSHPDDFDMIIVDGRENYARLMAVMEPEWSPIMGKNWDLVQHTAGGLVGSQAYYCKTRIPPAHMAVSLTSGHQMYRLARRPPDWLVQGFEGYCEYAVLGRNLIRGVDYRMTDVKISHNWWNDMQMLARLNRLQRLDTFLTKTLQDYEAVDYVESFAFVAYLLRSDPPTFLNFCKSLNFANDPQTALTETYGKSLDELQADWLKWLAAPR